MTDINEEQQEVWDRLKNGIGPVTHFAFIGTGETNSFSSRTLAGKRLIHVMVDGVVQSNFRDFRIVGTTIIFHETPRDGAIVDLTIYDK